MRLNVPNFFHFLFLAKRFFSTLPLMAKALLKYKKLTRRGRKLRTHDFVAAADISRRKKVKLIA